ncbi:MAG: RagB/SusD family nutrient uptake outer membrane protein [Tannerella sp.]|jgi:hypothetical protein|nr:RagB/SusD family nutrient uptake outer membrane protein [Tannerella sp.]
MKNKSILKTGLIAAITGSLFLLSSCRDNLLTQLSTTELASDLFWNTEEDATYALNGAYAQIRGLFDRDYMFDGQGEFLRFRSSAAANQSTDNAIAYRGGTYTNPGSASGSSYNNYFQYSYAGINRANYVIDNVTKMLENVTTETGRKSLEAIIGEARMMRGMIYFRLITMWGDVQYFDRIIHSNSEVSDLPRTPIAEVKDKIMEDFTYAYEHCTDKPVALGRFTKWGALAFRGKMKLYWACWNRTNWPWGKIVAPNGGWPELETFTANQSESDKSYREAAEDLRTVIEQSGLSLYMNGEPGEYGELGGCEVLPNYYHLFTPKANSAEELMVAFPHGGTGTGQGEELMRDFGTRAQEGSQGWAQARFSIVDLYQSYETGDFVKPVERLNPNTSADAYTRANSSLNPQSYINRDYRMKSSILWEGETMPGLLSLSFDRYRRFRYQTRTGTINDYPPPNEAINADADGEGIIMRKFIRNYAGQGRSDGDYNYPAMRLADAYLLYAEAANEAYGPAGDGGLAIDVVNKVRHRGNLPPLKPEKYADKETFFYAIEQERIIELLVEGHRFWDLRRWRSIERVWVEPQTSGGIRLYDSWGALKSTYFNNTSLLTYQRMYLFKIPDSERNKNPNLTQNRPWL